MGKVSSCHLLLLVWCYWLTCPSMQIGRRHQNISRVIHSPPLELTVHMYSCKGKVNLCHWLVSVLHCVLLCRSRSCNNIPLCLPVLYLLKFMVCMGICMYDKDKVSLYYYLLPAWSYWWMCDFICLNLPFFALSRPFTPGQNSAFGIHLVGCRCTYTHI